MLQYIDTSIARLTSRETNPINQARIRMLVYILFFYMLFAAVLTVAYLADGRSLYLIRAGVIFMSCFLLFGVLWYTNAWKLVSHLAICLITLTVWSNILIVTQGVSIITI